MNYIEAEIKNAATLVGGTITGAVRDEESAYYGLEIRMPDDKVVVAWVLSDTEGNGVGHLDIQKK